MKKILIIEDEEVLRDAFEMILERPGYYDVTTAHNGLVGLQKFKEILPDLVLLDIFMPVMDGRDFLRNIDLEQFPHTTIIVYSNLSDSATETEMRQLGAHGFVLKSSMTPGSLLDLVASQLENPNGV